MLVDLESPTSLIALTNLKVLRFCIVTSNLMHCLEGVTENSGHRCHCRRTCSICPLI